LCNVTENTLLNYMFYHPFHNRTVEESVGSYYVFIDVL